MKGSVTQDSTPFKHQLQVPVVTCTSDRLAINQGSHDPLIRFNNFIERLTEVREVLTYIYWFIIKDGGE